MYTSCIDFDASAQDIEDELAKFGDVGVTVSRCGDKTDVHDWGHVYRVTFTGNHNRGNQPQLVVVDADGATDSSVGGDGACQAYTDGGSSHVFDHLVPDTSWVTTGVACAPARGRP